jgi:cysteine desulfurase
MNPSPTIAVSPPSKTLAQRPIYLDCHATTPVDPRVLEVMLPYFCEKFGNAASVNHAFGWRAADAVEQARTQIATLLRTIPQSLIFTSGATEANNLALKGVLWRAPPGSHLIVGATEHRSVLDPARRLEREGYALTILPVDRFGRLDPQQVADAIQPGTALVSVMLANNEVGTIHPLDEIGDICRRRNVLLHCDAAQAVGRIAIDLEQLRVDLLSLSGHKLYGPQGIGALYIRRDRAPVRLTPLIDGGGHEQRLRSGTLPVPLVVGLGAACALAQELLAVERVRIAALRERLWDGLQRRLTDLSLNGHPTERLPGNLHVSFDGVDGEALMQNLKEIAVSSGSACTSADPEPSHVLRAMGVGEQLSKASLRFGLGRFTTSDEIDFAIDYTAEVVTRLRQRAAGFTPAV